MKILDSVTSKSQSLKITVTSLIKTSVTIQPLYANLAPLMTEPYYLNT